MITDQVRPDSLRAWFC